MSEYITKLEDALCMAICIIQNCANGEDIRGGDGDKLRRWAGELIQESGINFDDVLMRSAEKEEQELQRLDGGE